MTAPKVEVKVLPHEVSVLINGLPHLLLRRAEILGVQAYLKSTGVRDRLYFIEFSMKGGNLIISDYDERKLWEGILSALRDARLFENMLGSGPLPGSA